MIHLLMAMTVMLTNLPSAFAQGGLGTRDGTISIGRLLDQAKATALRAIDLVTVEKLIQNHADQDVIDFYSKNHDAFRTEVEKSKAVPRPQDEVKASVNGVYINVKAATNHYPLADIVVSEELNASATLEELTGTWLHEAGHHFGLEDENKNAPIPYGQRLFLDRLAQAIVNAAKQDASFVESGAQEPVKPFAECVPDFQGEHADGQHTVAYRFCFDSKVSFASDRPIFLARCDGRTVENNKISCNRNRITQELICDVVFENVVTEDGYTSMFLFEMSQDRPNSGVFYPYSSLGRFGVIVDDQKQFSNREISTFTRPQLGDAGFGKFVFTHGVR